MVSIVLEYSDLQHLSHSLCNTREICGKYCPRVFTCGMYPTAYVTLERYEVSTVLSNRTQTWCIYHDCATLERYVVSIVLEYSDLVHIS